MLSCCITRKDNLRLLLVEVQNCVLRQFPVLQNCGSY